MVSLVGRLAPDFRGDAVMSDGTFGEISLSQFRDKQAVLLFFYPFDFTFVCPSEIIAFDKAVKDFQQRNVQLIGCSIDSKFVHAKWRLTPHNEGGIGEISYPLLEDVSHKIAQDYGVLLPEGMALRGLFLIDKQGIVQHAVINNLPLGRSSDEAIRMIDALQFYEQYGEVCPANWKKGAKGITATAKGIAEYLSSHVA